MESPLQKVKTNLPDIITCGSFGSTFEKLLHHSFIAFKIIQQALDDLCLPIPRWVFAEECSFLWDLERKEVQKLLTTTSVLEDSWESAVLVSRGRPHRSRHQGSP